MAPLIKLTNGTTSFPLGSLVILFPFGSLVILAWNDLENLAGVTVC